MPKWLVYVEKSDGGDRESWNVFYTDCYVADTEEEAKRIGKAELEAWKDKEEAEDGERPEYGEIYVTQESDRA